jgi:hypothetical protein
MSQGFPAGKIDAVQVSRHQLSPVFRGGSRERAKDRHRSVVDEHVQFPKRSDRVFHKALHALLIRHISGVNKRPCYVEACNRFLQLVFTPSVEDDQCAFLQKAARRAGADTRTGPCDDKTLSSNLFMIPLVNLLGCYSATVSSR